MDDQVKLRGFLVELAEIRNLLAGHPRVADAFVTVTGEGNAGKQLLAACVAANDGLDVAELAAFLSARLPGYMVPGRWAVVGELPLTANGKVDRKALQRAARPVAASAGTGC